MEVLLMRSLFQMNILAVRKRRLLTELKRSSGCGPVRCHFCRDCPHPEGHCDRRYGTFSRPADAHRRSKLILLIFLGCFALVVAVWHLNQLTRRRLLGVRSGTLCFKDLGWDFSSSKLPRLPNACRVFGHRSCKRSGSPTL